MYGRKEGNQLKKKQGQGTEFQGCCLSYATSGYRRAFFVLAADLIQLITTRPSYIYVTTVVVFINILLILEDEPANEKEEKRKEIPVGFWIVST